MEIDENLEINTIRRECDLDQSILLEIGCGDGRLSFGLSKFVKELIAIDPSEKDIIKAKDKLDSTGSIKNLNFSVGSGENLNFKDSYFDIILYSQSFHHVPVKKQITAIKQAHRALNDKGHLIIYEPLKKGDMQKLFLVFEDELNEMNHVYKAIRESEKIGLFAITKRIKFTTTWKFEDFGELIRYFGRLYGEKNVENNLKQVKNILKENINKKPLIIDDDLILIVMKVKK